MKTVIRLTSQLLLILAIFICFPSAGFIKKAAAEESEVIEAMQFRDGISYRVANTSQSIWIFDYLELFPSDAAWDFTLFSSNEDVLSASYPYLLIKGSGTTAITVSSNQNPSITVSHEFTVTDPVKPVEIVSLTAPQQTVYVNHESSSAARISYVDGAALTETVWISEDPSIACISAGNRTAAFITGKKAGTTVIKAASAYNMDLCVNYEITVKDELPPAGSYHIELMKCIGSTSTLEPMPDPLYLDRDTECRLLVKASSSNILPTDEAIRNGSLFRSDLIEITDVTPAGRSYSKDGSSSKSWYVTLKAVEYGEEKVTVGDLSFNLAVNPPPVKPPHVYRIYGSSRFETNLKTVSEIKQLSGTEQFDSVILCSGLNYADALTGSYLSFVKNAPILITADFFSGIEYSRQVNEYIQKNLRSGGTIYILGGNEAVSEQAAAGLENFNIKRLAGKDRYETNIRILEEAGVSGENILVCTGFGFADSLSASAAKRPILLVGKELNDMQKSYLIKHTDSKYYVIGGVNAVNPSIETELTKYGKVKRIAGATRHETSILIAEKFFPEAESAVLAYSGNFPDGLCGGPLASVFNAPVILTMNGRTEAAVQFCENHNIKEGYVLGGPGLISDYNVRKIFSYSGHLQLR